MIFPSFIRIAVNEIRGVCELGQDAGGKTIIADGSDAEFLKLLSESLNFRYDLFETEDKQWGVEQPDGNWTGLIGKVHRNETDMSMCAITMTAHRSYAVHFSYPYEVQQLVFATRSPNYIPKVMAFVYPFSPGLWFSVLALKVLMPFVWKVLLSTAHPVRRLFFDVFASFLSESINVKITSFRDYVLLGSWLFGTCFLTLSYTAVLLSFLTLPLQERLVRNIPELADAVDGGSYKVKGFKGTIIGDLLQNSPVRHVSRMGRAIENNAWYVSAGETSVKNAVYEGNTAVIAMRSFFETFGDSIALSKDEFLPLNLGLVVGKGFCCTELLDHKLRWMVAAGLYRKCKKDFQFRARLKHLASDDSSAEVLSGSLSLGDLSGAFVMLCLGYGISVSAIVVEVCLAKVTCAEMSAKVSSGV